jgi:hypothetical protein
MPDGFMPKYKRQARLWLPADGVAKPADTSLIRMATKGPRGRKRNNGTTKAPNMVKPHAGARAKTTLAASFRANFSRRNRQGTGSQAGIPA